MAKVAEIDQDLWNKWVEGRPPEVKALCKRRSPDRLYRMKSSGRRVTIYSYSEDGTVTVNVSGKYNALTFERQVFGVDPDDLEECDLPKEDEPLGVLLTEREDVGAFIDEVRPTILTEREADNAS